MANLQLRSDFGDLIAQRGQTVRGFARVHGLSHQTLFGLLHPEWQPDQRRKGGMRKDTAWKIANAWAAETGQEPANAFKEIIVEDA